MDQGTATFASACVIALAPSAVAYFSARSVRLAAKADAAAKVLADKVAADKVAAAVAAQAAEQAVLAKDAAAKLTEIADTSKLTHTLVNSAADKAERKSVDDTGTIRDLTAQVATLTAQVTSLTNVLVNKTVGPEKQSQ